MPKVYIGVGHGGTDPGAVSGSYKESAFALDISTACTAELKSHGVTVMQSRTSDVTESAAAKIKECNAYNPDIALDIHLNAGGGDGFEIYHSINGGKGKTLAAAIETAVKAIGQNSRGLKTKKNSSGKDYFGIIRQTSCPAVLVECAFIDSKDVQIVDTAAERATMGVAIAHGILKYFGIAIKTDQPSAGTPAPAPAEKKITVELTQLHKGSKGAEVLTLQRLLRALGYTDANKKAIEIDGDFGAATDAALKKYQKAHALDADGYCGVKTWSKILKGV